MQACGLQRQGQGTRAVTQRYAGLGLRKHRILSPVQALRQQPLAQGDGRVEKLSAASPMTPFLPTHRATVQWIDNAHQRYFVAEIQASFPGHQPRKQLRRLRCRKALTHLAEGRGKS